MVICHPRVCLRGPRSLFMKSIKTLMSLSGSRHLVWFYGSGLFVFNSIKEAVIVFFMEIFILLLY